AVRRFGLESPDVRGTVEVVQRGGRAQGRRSVKGVHSIAGAPDDLAASTHSEQKAVPGVEVDGAIVRNDRRVGSVKRRFPNKLPLWSDSEKAAVCADGYCAIRRQSRMGERRACALVLPLQTQAGFGGWRAFLPAGC